MGITIYLAKRCEYEFILESGKMVETIVDVRGSGKDFEIQEITSVRLVNSECFSAADLLEITKQLSSDETKCIMLHGMDAVWESDHSGQQDNFCGHDLHDLPY